MLDPLIRYVAAAKDNSQENFLASFPKPALVLEPFDALGATGFQTISARGTGRGIATVAWVSKRDGANAFASMITLGRAANNDIELKHPGISKFHAYFRADPDGGLQLVDAGSKYGTWLGLVQLEARQPVPIASGCDLRFAQLTASFFQPADFYEFLLDCSDDGSPGKEG